MFKNKHSHAQGGLIWEGVLTLVPLPTKGAKSCPWAENLNKLFAEKCEKFEFSAQGRDLAALVRNGAKFKIPSEIKPPLLCKGQLSSKCPFGAFKSPKKPTIFFQDFCPSF